MVKSGEAARIIDDATAVLLEGRAAGIDSHSNRLLGNGRLELILLVLRHIRVGRNANRTVVEREAAVAQGNVRVLLLGEHTGSLSVAEAVSLPATTAALVFGHAINALLLRKLDALASLDEVSALHGSDGREAPAGAAPALILDGLHGAFLNPVDRSGQVGQIEADLVSIANRVRGIGTEETGQSVPLIRGPIRELVVSDLMHVLLIRVPLLNELVYLGEQLLAELVLLLGCVGLAMDLKVADKGSFQLTVGVVIAQHVSPLPRVEQYLHVVKSTEDLVGAHIG